jgi:hypothetical protein
MKKLLVLAVVGVAIKLFLDSDKGQELKQKVLDLISDAQDAINEYLEKATEKVEDVAGTVDTVVRKTT